MTDAELARGLGAFHFDPLGFSQVAYPWGREHLADSAGPRPWQASVMDHIRDALTTDPHKPIRIAIVSGHGIGKSALIGMLKGWAMSTCDDCRIVTTAGGGPQLKTKTVPEVAKWFRSMVNAHWWEIQATSIRQRDPAHAATWRDDYVTWDKDNPQAFAGLHNRGKRIVIVFDEASAIPRPIWETVEGAMTDEGTEIIFLAFGNPTQNTGAFRECFGSQKHRWHTMQIDSRDVEGTNKAEIAEWIATYGEDSDFVRVRVRGEFPRASSTQFIPSDIVAAARRYKSVGHFRMPTVMACDVARFGDDQTVVGLRQGRKLDILAKWRGLDTQEVAGRLAKLIDLHAPDAWVIDGDGLGAGVVDRLKALGYGRKLTEFHGGGKPDNVAMYFNRRAECWGLLRDWLQAGAQVPDDPELETDLCGVEYGLSNKQQIQLEKKEDMKSRGLASPDLGDMAAMTFAVTVALPGGNRVGSRQSPPSPVGPGAWMG